MSRIQFEKTCDVAVAGGGIAGIAAALQSARSGMKTILIEKTILPGGLATTGLVYIFLPLCDGNGRQVTFGITEELIRASIQYGPGAIPEKWHEGVNAPEQERFRCVFSPAAFMLALDELLENAGVDIWFDTLLCDTEMSGDKITAAIVENKSGRGRIRARCFIDASGDCSLARSAGIPCHDEYNFLSIWALQYNNRMKNSGLGENLQMAVDGVPWDVEKAPAGTVFRGISGKTVSDFVLKSRKMLRDSYKRSYAADPVSNTPETLFALKVPAMPQFRKIFGIDAAYVLDSGENNRFFEDSIGLVADWRKAGPVWEIPYRTLIPEKKIGAFLAAGRCTGAKNDAWEVTRVIPPAAMTGQAAGLAAALSIRDGVEPYALDVKKLQAGLRAGGSFPLHLEEIGLPAGKR